MIIAHSPSEVPAAVKPTVVSIGVFDGVHKGHQMLLRRVIERAASSDAAPGATPGVVTFDRHPLQLIAPGKEPAMITTVPQRAEVLESLGMGVLLVLAFDDALRSLEPEDFVRRVLVEGLDVRHVVVGSNFRFGYNHAGTVQTLHELGEIHGFGVDIFSLLGGADAISSTLIRKQIGDGEVEVVAQELGRPFCVEGLVVHGAGRGKGLGIPTANLATRPGMVQPKIGVYAGWLVCNNDGRAQRVPAVINVGLNPTFEERLTPVIEVHALDFNADLYDQTVRVEFTHRLRDEMRFEGAEPLIAAINDDIARARVLLNL